MTPGGIGPEDASELVGVGAPGARERAVERPAGDLGRSVARDAGRPGSRLREGRNIGTVPAASLHILAPGQDALAPEAVEERRTKSDERRAAG